ncbi:hypothetical protein I3843_11G074300 [Carya illinoinensis]|nr:hypothetical protein I3843_11G074300 [Carya illinoinensis]
MPSSSSSEMSFLAAAVFFFLPCDAVSSTISCGLAETPCAPPSSSSFLMYSLLLWCKNPCFFPLFFSYIAPYFGSEIMLYFVPNVKLEARFFLTFSLVFSCSSLLVKP